VEGFGQRQNGVGRRVPVIGRERNVTLAIVEQRLTRNIPREAFFLFALHRLGGPAQGIAREA
jgi:hypothetical protein